MKSKSGAKKKTTPEPLNEAKLKRRLKPRRALASTAELKASFDLMAAARQKLVVKDQVKALGKGAIYRPGAPLFRGGSARKAIRLVVEIQGAELGTHVFPPSVPGKRLKLPRETAKMRALAKQGLPDLDGYLPDHLPLNPIPQKLDKKLQVRRFLVSPKKKPSKRERTEATTVFLPEDRYTFSDTSFPWCTIGRVDTAGGQASGVLIGPRHLLTVSHAMVWNADNSCGWVRFRPSYFDGSAPFGEAWATRWYAYRKVVGPSLSRAESRGGLRRVGARSKNRRYLRMDGLEDLLRFMGRQLLLATYRLSR